MAMTTQIAETRRIPTTDGQELVVEMTQGFIDRLRQHFGLFGDQRLEDDHVKSYVLGAVTTAVTRAEQKVENDAAQEPGQPKRVRRARRRTKDA